MVQIFIPAKSTTLLWNRIDANHIPEIFKYEVAEAVPLWSSNTWFAAKSSIRQYPHSLAYKYRRFPSTGASQWLTLSRLRRAFENQSSIRGLASAEPQSHRPYPVPAVRQSNWGVAVFQCPFWMGTWSFLKSWDLKSRSQNYPLVN